MITQANFHHRKKRIHKNIKWI